MENEIYFSCKNRMIYSNKKNIKFWIFDIPSKEWKNEIICKKATPMCKKIVMLIHLEIKP